MTIITNTNHAAASNSFFTRNILFILTSLLIIGSAAVFWYSLQQTRQLNEEIALRETSLFARSIERFRSFYADHIIPIAQQHGLQITHEQHQPDSIPTPSTLMPQLGILLAQDTDTRYQMRVYSQHPFPWNKAGSARDDFERWALQELSQHSDKAVWRFEENQHGQKLLRYALPNRMEANCIGCHQSYPGTPKTDWKIGDLAGITSISRDISETETAAATNLTEAFLLILVLGLVGLGILAETLRNLHHSLAEAHTAMDGIREANQQLATGIEERETLAATLQDNQAKTRIILDSIADAVIVADPEGTIIETNPAAAEVFGYTQSELQGQNFTALMPINHATLHNQTMKRYFFTHKARILGKAHQLQVIRKDGKEIPLEMTIKEARVGNSSLFTSISRDITERLQIKQAMTEARDAALEATRVRSEFLANMSHEIRTPMNAIIGMSQLLLDTPLNGEQQELAQTVWHSGESLLHIVNDILDLSRIEVGKFNLYKGDVDLRELLAGIVRLLRESAEHKGLALHYNLDDKIPPMIVTDAVRLRQILINLLSNAIKFTEQGHVSLHIRVAATRQDSLLLRFEVKDTGCGIRAEDIPKLFNAFSQVDGSSTRQHGGAGLGLAISKQLAQLLGGDMGVDSSTGTGSCFWFTSAVQTTAQPDAAISAPTVPSDNHGVAPAKTAATHTSPMPTPARILLVEDHLVNQKVALAMLKKLGYGQADCAQNGQEALAMVQEHAYDIVLMDCQMPVMDGYEAARAIRRLGDSRFRELPIIALTAHAMKGDDEKCYAAGMDDYLTKPVQPIPLQEHLHKWLRAKIPPEHAPA